MSIFADPRAVGIMPIVERDEDEVLEIHLVDRNMRVLASAICYESERSKWWGVCSHHSGIPIDKRASTGEEASQLLWRTVWMFKVGVERDEYAYFTESSRWDALYIRSLLDEEVLEAARDDESPAWRRISAWMGPDTNPSWITHQCAETAYMRGVMDAQEMDWITR